MATTFELKEDQLPHQLIEEVEVIVTRTKEEAETICLKNLDSSIQRIDDEILRLMDEKDRLQTERTFILVEAQKFHLTE